MSLQAWLLFCATETILCLTPGPAVLLVISESLSRGTWSGLSASAGILAANALYFGLSATSLGAVLVASWRIFVLIKFIGAGYLVWLGTRMVLSRWAAATGRPTDEGARPLRQSFSLAVLTQGANPKALIFFTAILPQFIDPAMPLVQQILVLGISSVLIEFLVLSMYVATCHTAREWASGPRVATLFERIGGAFLIGAGVRLAFVRRG